MSMLPLPLLRRRPLLPGESLPSLLMRLAKANHHNPPSILVGLALARDAKQGYYRDISANLLQGEVFERLAALTKLECLEIYASTIHRFATVITPPTASIEYVRISKDQSLPLLARGVAQIQLRPEYAVQFCPECVRDSAYHRLIWAPIGVTACLQHKRLLADYCFQCNKRIKIIEITENRCSQCGSNLSDFHTPEIGADEFGLLSQRILQSWLLSEQVICDEIYSLPDQPAKVLYRFLYGLRVAIIHAESKWPQLQRLSIKLPEINSMKVKKPQSLTPYQSYCLQAAAFKALISWPSAFFDFLDIYRSLSSQNKHARHAVAQELGDLYIWLKTYCQYPEFGFVQQALNDYLVSNYSLSHQIIRSKLYQTNQNLAQSLSYINLQEAARFLCTTPKMIKSLIKTGRLTPYFSSDAHKFTLLDKREVLELRDVWNMCIDLTQTSQWIGISERVILDIVKIGLLVAEHSPAEGFAHWKFSRETISEFLKSIIEHIEISSSKQNNALSFLRLYPAARLFNAKTGLNAAYMLLQVSKGSLKAYHLGSPKIQLRDLLFFRADIDKCVRTFEIENNLVKRKEAQEILGVADSTLALWVKTGLISTILIRKNVQYFDRTVLNNFLALHVTSREAANILGTSRLSVQGMVRAGYLEAVSGPNIDGFGVYIFNKDSLCNWKSNWLKDAEAMQILGITDKQEFNKCIEQDKVEVLQPPNGYKRWISKQAVLRLLNP